MDLSNGVGIQIPEASSIEIIIRINLSRGESLSMYLIRPKHPSLDIGLLLTGPNLF